MKKSIKELYNRYPWNWVRQYQLMREWDNSTARYEPTWGTVAPGNNVWEDYTHYRLLPKLPNLPKPAPEMINRAVYLGRGKVILPECVDTFSGWQYCENKRPKDWVYSSAWFGAIVGKGHYCIDVNDPNADEIIKLNSIDENSAEAELLLHISTFGKDRFEKLMQSEFKKAKKFEETYTNIDNEWISLDQCELRHVYTTLTSEDDVPLHEILAHAILDPRKVLIRRKR